MNEQQLALFESLQDREALYMRRDGLTKVVKLNLDSPQLRGFLYQAERPGTTVEADRQVRTHRRNHPLRGG